MNEEWISLKDAAAELNLNKRTVSRFIDDGTLPGYKLGGLVRIKRADLDALFVRIEPVDR